MPATGFGHLLNILARSDWFRSELVDTQCGDKKDKPLTQIPHPNPQSPNPKSKCNLLCQTISAQKEQLCLPIQVKAGEVCRTSSVR